MDDLVKIWMDNYKKYMGIDEVNYSNKFEDIKSQDIINHLELNNENVDVEEIKLNISGIILYKEKIVDINDIGYSYDSIEKKYIKRKIMEEK